jgi:hypothetical protein
LGYHHNWVIQVLPFLEQDAAYQRIDRQVGVYHKNNAPVRRHHLRVFHCPSDRRLDTYTHYAAVHHDVEAAIDTDNHGVFFLNSRVARDDILDGLSHTVFLGEKLCEPGDLGWMSGTRATLRNTGEPIDTARDHYRNRRWSLPALPPGLGPAGRDQEALVPDEPLDPAGSTELGEAADARRAADFVGGFSSFHPGVANFAMGDGSIRLLAKGISPQVMQRLGHRSDGQLLDLE